MGYNPKRTVLILLLSVCIVFPVFFTETLIVADLAHGCENEGNCTTTTEEDICYPCLQMELAKNFLKIQRSASVIANPAFNLTFSTRFTENNAVSNYCSLSSVKLKVRFNT